MSLSDIGVRKMYSNALRTFPPTDIDDFLMIVHMNAFCLKLMTDNDHRTQFIDALSVNRKAL